MLPGRREWRDCRGTEKSLNIQRNYFQNLTKIITAGSPPRVSCGGPQLQVQTHYSIVCAGAPVRRFPWRDTSKLISGANHVRSPAAPVWQRRAPANSGTGDDCGGRSWELWHPGRLSAGRICCSEYSSMRDRVTMAGETNYWTISRPGAERSRIMKGCGEPAAVPVIALIEGAGILRARRSAPVPSSGGSPSPAALPGLFREFMQCREVLHYFPPQPPFLLGLPGIATAQSMEAFKRILPPAATAHPRRPANQRLRT